jgi:hypothetical protein
MKATTRQGLALVLLWLLVLGSCDCEHHRPDDCGCPEIRVRGDYRIILYDATGADRGYRLAKSFQPSLTHDRQLVDADGFELRIPSLAVDVNRVRIDSGGTILTKWGDGSRLWSQIGSIPLAITPNGAETPGRTYSETEIDELRVIGVRGEGQLCSPVEWEVVREHSSTGVYHLRVVGDPSRLHDGNEKATHD